MIEEFEF